MFLDVGLLEFSNRGGKKCLRNENQWNPYDEDEKVCENFWSISNMYLQIETVEIKMELGLSNMKKSVQFHPVS